MRLRIKVIGVSVSTAPGRSMIGMSPQTKARVLAAAERLGYVRCWPRACGPAQPKRGVVVTNITNSFYANVVAGVEDVMDAHGYNIVLNSTYEDPEREMRAIKLLLEQRVDGIILRRWKASLPLLIFSIRMGFHTLSWGARPATPTPIMLSAMTSKLVAWLLAIY